MTTLSLKAIKLLLCFFLSLATQDLALAALQSKNAPISLESTYNPRPLKQDILLPMPHGLKLALRVIAIPGGLASDRRFYMGVNQIDEQRQVYESSFESHIAASFEAKDLPKEWSKELGVSASEGFSYYFLGKYEVSKLQWAAIMEGLDAKGQEIPWQESQKLTCGANLPITEVSWFEVQDFLKRYNSWLIKHSMQNLPKYAGTTNIGFFRLPTEEEWEFAARGGILVKEEDRENNDSFVSSGDKPEDYGVFVSKDTPLRSEPLPLGSRKPNPLGLFDTMGNVREMIDGFFRLTIEELGEDNRQRRRLHGASGGLLCKGGSFRSEGQGVLPGWRDEVPLYTSSGEYRAKDLGFRLVLAGLNIPSANRLAMINRAEARMEPVSPKKEETPKRDEPQEEQKPVLEANGTPEKLLKIDRQGNLLAEIDRISDATSSSVVRANLAQLRSVIAERERAVSRQQEDFLESTLRSTLYQAETIRAFAFRYIQVTRMLEEAKTDQKINDLQKKQAEKMRTGYYHVLLTAANQYKSHLRRISQVRPSLVTRILAQFQQEYSGAGTLDRHMLQNCATLEKHLKIVRDKGLGALSSEQICQGIIPKKHLDSMPHFVKK
ncbi:MAG: SUMF1/EgtB/PvdO family nonheme iron enzyme [Desulfovibrionaceae bacterium]|nr:SUMF1/EgtB/PvdO family nonheme iron enzyme [Desulfovibrionaceae bacterium]